MKTVAFLWFGAGAMVAFGFIFSIAEGPRFENLVPPGVMVFFAVMASREVGRERRQR